LIVLVRYLLVIANAFFQKVNLVPIQMMEQMRLLKTK